MITQSPPRAVEDHDFGHRRQFGTLFDELVDLILILGEYHRLPESPMNATSSAFVVGYTVVVAPPADKIPKSAMTHSYRVEEASATRCSGSIPRAISPAAMPSTRSPTSRQVTLTHPSAHGYRNASEFGVAAHGRGTFWAPTPPDCRSCSYRAVLRICGGPAMGASLDNPTALNQISGLPVDAGSGHVVVCHDA